MLAERQAEAHPGTWVITQLVRRALARTVLDLRAALEEDFGKQLRALGIREDGIKPPSSGRALAPAEQHARDVACAVVRREVESGATSKQAFETYVRDSAFTFLNRMVGLRCLDERGLLLVDGQPETAVKRDPARNASSLYWRVRNEFGSTTPPREVWRETLRRAGAAVSERVRVLFDPNSEYAALLPLQPTLQQVMDALNTPEVPSATYAQDEFLGWVYQYYNAREKADAYAQLAKGKKLERPEELVAATCLYTERYIVDYLLQNTVGALWLEMHPDSGLPERWPYFVRRAPDAPKLSRQVRPLREITILDPACGSGHFLVRAFDLLASMYREEGREPEQEISHLILERNLHGIDIDLRAVQIAALSLYMKGCEMAGPDFRPRQLNLVAADAVLAGDEPAGEYLARFPGDREVDDLVKGVWQSLKNVREFGSLLHPEQEVDEAVKRKRDRERGQLWQWEDARWDEWKHELLQSLREEFERQAQSDDLGQRLFGEEAAKGVSLVEALSRKYDVVVMNPPYAGSKNLNERLRKFVEREYKAGKRDLYAAFIQRCCDFACHGGYVGMVAQQTWMFLRSFAGLRKEVLERTSITTLAHLGENAFEESAAAGAFVALFTLLNAPPSPDQQLVAFRLIGPKSPGEKEVLLRRALAGDAVSVVSTPRQSDFMEIPEKSFVYWLRPRFLAMLSSGMRLGSQISSSEGLGTRDDERFVRYFWETVPKLEKWFPFVKGGGYQRWWGLNYWVVDYEHNGSAIKEHIVGRFPYLKGNFSWLVRTPDFYGKPGLTFTDIARGALGVRVMPPRAIFTDKGPALFPETISQEALAAYLNSPVVTYLLRALSPTLQFRTGYIRALPACPIELEALRPLVLSAIAYKQKLSALDLLERTFLRTHLETTQSPLYDIENQTERTVVLLHTLEAVIAVRVAKELQIGEDIESLFSEVATPAGWHPLLTGYDAIPTMPDGSQPGIDLSAELAGHERRTLKLHELAPLKTKLYKLYQAGPDGRMDLAEDEDDVSGADEEAAIILGARISIPTETFIEALAQEMEIHPISVYWLLMEMSEQSRLVSPSELNHQLEDYVSVTSLRLLGYRWPEQDSYEQVYGPILDPALVDEDGIIPLIPCGDQPTVLERVRIRLESDFGGEGAEQSEQEFRQRVGRDLGDWLRRDFFKRHVKQFKQRPIAWHLVSPDRSFEALVLYHKLSRATLQKLRVQYAGGLIARLRGEQDRARLRGATEEVSRLQLQIEDVEEFRTRIEKIERGDELAYRIRCRWKGEEATGRPGPYDPDIDDGVKVNIRPFQEAGLLAVREVIKKW